MNGEPPTITTRDRDVEELVAAYLHAMEAGREKEWLGEDPRRAELLTPFLANRVEVEQILAGLAMCPSAPGPFGDFELKEELGRGGMGVVYRAYSSRLNHFFALKVLLGGELADDDDRERSRREVKAMASLYHPHIVPVYQAGEYDGWLFFTMPLLDGGSLADRRNRFRDDPAAAAALTAKIAEAVHHAHNRGVLHCDLKPANILLDRDGKPYVADFGLAKRIDQAQHLTETGGTPCYMAPEQAAGPLRNLTTAVDVHGLGLILYELLTGVAPFGAQTTREILHRVVERKPQSPHELDRRIDRDLSAVCLKCLEKDPLRRYGSAAELAKDLGRWQRGEPVEARPTGRTERLWYWCCRHPDRVGLIAAAVLLLVGAFALSVGVARARAARLEEETLTGNVYAARGVANTILWQMDRLSQPVLETAADKKLADLLEQHRSAENAQVRDDVGKNMHNFLCDVFKRYSDPARALVQSAAEPPFQTWHLLDAKGVLVADTSEQKHVVGEPSGPRDYFRARAGQRGRASVHISQIYQSRTDKLHKFALSVAVRRSPTEPILGVIAATLTTTATLGSLRLDDERRTAVLVGRRDLSFPGALPEPPGGEDYIVLLHPAYTRGVPAAPMAGGRWSEFHRPHAGDEFQLPDAGPPFDRSLVTDAEYVDPVGALDARFRGRWLAGFAPVGNTEFVVVVQQRYDETIGPEWTLVWNTTFWAGVGATLGVLLLGVLLRWWLARPRFGVAQ